MPHTYVATEFAINFSQKQFIIFQPLEIFSFSIWRESANPRFKPRVNFIVTPLQLPPLLAEVLSQLTWRMVGDLLCHKGDVAFTDPGDWSFRDWLLWDRERIPSLTLPASTGDFPEKLSPSLKASKKCIAGLLSPGTMVFSKE